MKKIAAFLGSLGLGAMGWIKRRHVVVIALLICLVWVGAIEAQPSAVKGGAAPSGNERTEIGNGGLKDGECGFEKGVNVVRPIGDGGVDGAKLGKNGRTEGNASCGPAPATPSAITKPRGKTNGHYDGSYLPELTDEVINECLQWGLLSVLLTA